MNEDNEIRPTTPEPEPAPEQTPDEKKRRRLPRWLRITLKTIAWTAVSIVTLIVLALCLVVWILTPERLTPLAERFANDYLVDAQVAIGRVELTVWKTFPQASVEVNDLQIISSALCGDSIPAYADSLLSVGRLRAEINLAKVPLMQFYVKEVTIDSPQINLVALNDSTNNYSITPPSEPDTTKSKMTVLPKIVVERFALTNNRGIRYTDLSRHMSATLCTDTLRLTHDRESNSYDLTFDGNVLAQLADLGIDQAVPFRFDGRIGWNTDNPLQCSLTDFHAEVAKIPVTVNTRVALGDTLSVNALRLDVGPIRYSDMTAQIPQQYLHGIERVKSNLSVAMSMQLDRPYRPTVDSQPSFHAQIDIPECYIQPGRYDAYRINRFGTKAKLAYNGDHPDRSVVELQNLLLDGFGINLKGSGTATNLLKDPNISGALSGDLNFARLLKLIPKELPLQLSGSMGLNTTFKFALSDLNVKSFHKIQVNGDVTFADVVYNVPKDSTLAFVDHATIRFGTNAKFTNKDNQLKNLLMASIAVDSAEASMPGLQLTLCNASVGAGSVGAAADLLDTTKITPIGARLKIGKLRMLSTADSASLRLTDLESNGSIRRDNTPGGKPRFDFGIKVGRIRATDRTTSVNLREGDITLAANARVRKSRSSNRTQARIDSLSRIYPELSRDSIMSLYRAQRRKANRVSDADDDYVNLAVDNKLQKLLRNWDFHGKLTAKRGSLFTPYFPLRNRLRNVDMDFSLDTFAIHSMKYSAGHSDMSISGEVRNIRRTLMGSKKHPLTIDFDINSDTLDVNQLIATMYKGQAFSDDTIAKSNFNIANIDDADEEKMQASIDDATTTDTTQHRAIIIPKNVAVELKVRNKYARYADLDITNLRSDLLINNGVANLRRLSGRAYDGQLDLDLVYASANKNEIGAGMYLKLTDIQVGKFLKLMPGLDSIMPMLKGVDGVIDARLLASTRIDSLMNVIMPSTNAALSIEGKNLVLLDSETFRKISKMLMFKNKQRNLIDSLAVEVAAYDSRIDVYPFMLTMDRYRLGMSGYNDFDMNYNYHVSILKSPLPFKFGINISGNADDMKIRLGKAKIKENEVARTSLVNDTTKVNLFNQMQSMLRKGAQAALQNSDLYDERKKSQLRKMRKNISDDDQLSQQDSLNLINEGIIERPDTIAVPDADPAATKQKRNRKGDGTKNQSRTKIEATKPDEK
ncbi:MAG: AsmA-like C-terminal region-containing protein [Bacteroidales bacterium]|nr:AsmA-like C-terminal region-containing protein [Bacteroidales bacterium]